jgi:hypothetical protein
MTLTRKELAVLFTALEVYMETLVGTEQVYRDAAALMDRVSEEIDR